MRNTTVALGAGDQKLVELIQERLGCSQSDAIRTSVRVYAAILAQQK